MKYSRIFRLTITPAALVVISLFLVQCHKEKFTTNPSDMLEFSTDTILFDTVFTTIGSTTQVLKVYNRHSESIRISHIEIENGTSSPYRMNVDGIDGIAIDEVEILPEDSIFIFVEVTLDPNNENYPFIIEDHIRFETNGNVQRVLLQAWGRDAHFHGEADGFYVITQNETWIPDKPHVIYGIVAVDEGLTLTINPGTTIYVHQGGGLYIYKSKLIAEGFYDLPITFCGDRLESEFADLPGQWGIEVDVEFQSGIGPEIVSISRGGLWFVESTGSTLNWVNIKNGNIGIQVDTTGTTDYALTMNHTKVTNMGVIGLWAQEGHVKGENSLFANCGQSCAALTIGGKYNFRHCTFGNYWTYGTRSAPTFILNNYYEDINQNLQVRPLEEGLFRDCIFYGNNAQLNDFNEFVLDLEDHETLFYQFQDCIVDTDENIEDDDTHWFEMHIDPPSFVSPSTLDFHLTGTSSQNQSTINYSGYDLGNNEWGFPFEIGCYDFD